MKSFSIYFPFFSSFAYCSTTTANAIPVTLPPVPPSPLPRLRATPPSPRDPPPPPFPRTQPRPVGAGPFLLPPDLEEAVSREGGTVAATPPSKRGRRRPTSSRTLTDARSGTPPWTTHRGLLRGRQPCRGWCQQANEVTAGDAPDHRFCLQDSKASSAGAAGYTGTSARDAASWKQRGVSRISREARGADDADAAGGPITDQ